MVRGGRLESERGNSCLTRHMSRVSMVIALAIFSVPCLFSCNKGGYLPETAFVDLYADLKLASIALAQDLGKAGEIRRAILAQHDMTPAQFHDQFVRLAGHPESWKPFQEMVVGRIDALQKKQGEKNVP